MHLLCIGYIYIFAYLYISVFIYTTYLNNYLAGHRILDCKDSPYKFSRYYLYFFHYFPSSSIDLRKSDVILITEYLFGALFCPLSFPFNLSISKLHNNMA